MSDQPSPEVQGFWARWRRENGYEKAARDYLGRRTQPEPPDPTHLAAVARVIAPLVPNRMLRIRIARAILTTPSTVVHEAMDDLLTRERYHRR